MSTLLHPVPRKLAAPDRPIDVMAELVNWAGIALMVHARRGSTGNAAHIWTCSHERTGYAVAHGTSPEAALEAAIALIRKNHAQFTELCMKMPALNT